jgi:hypothetical protein
LAHGTTIKKHGTKPPNGGFKEGLETILGEVSPEIHKVTSVCVVTDAVKDAINNAKDLGRVSLFRLASPEGHDSPPLLDRLLEKEILSDFYVLKGGHGFDGRLIASPSESEIEAAYEKAKARAESFVISSPFSMLFSDHEHACRELLAKLGAKKVWATSDVSSMPSILDRESTAIFSASASRIIEKLEAEVVSALANYGCHPRVYFGRNDGTIIGSRLAARFPLETAWGVEGHSASGVSRLLGKAGYIIASKDGPKTWIVGARGGRPLLRKITYLRDTLVHVTSPIVAEFLESARAETKTLAFGVMSQLVGGKKAYSTGGSKVPRFPFPVRRSPKFDAAAAINVVLSSVDWEHTVCLPKDSDLAKAKKKLRSSLLGLMKQGGARKVKFGQVTQHAGFNLPEGTTRLSLRATGIPG